MTIIGTIKNLFTSQEELNRLEKEKQEKLKKQQEAQLEEIKTKIENLLLGNFFDDTGKVEYFTKANEYRIKIMPKSPVFESMSNSEELEKLEREKMAILLETIEKLEKELLEVDKKLSLSKIGDNYSILFSEKTEKSSKVNTIKNFLILE